MLGLVLRSTYDKLNAKHNRMLAEMDELELENRVLRKQLGVAPRSGMDDPQIKELFE